MSSIYKFSWDTRDWPFRKVIQHLLQCSELEHIHEIYQYDKFVRETDQKTEWHKRYYNGFHIFQDLYQEFIDEVIQPHFGWKDIVYQKIPTFRTHLVNNTAVGSWHKDSEFGHSEEEINCFLPFTNAVGNSAVWIESEPDKGDYKPYDCNYGEILVFHGSRLHHGNKINDTPHSRISVDFRVLDRNNFKPSSDGSVNTKSKFDIGYYFLSKHYPS